MKFKNWSLKLKITLVTGLLLAALTLAMIWQSQASMNATIHKTLESDINGFAESVSGNLGTWMKDRVRAIKKVAQAISEHPNIPPHVMLEQTKQSLDFIITYLGTVDGQMLENDPNVILKNYDPRVRSWYKGAEQSNDLFISAPYTSLTSGKYVVTIAYPARRNGQLLGIVGGNLTLDALTDTTAQMTVPGHGYILLIDDSDQLIAHPDEQWRRKPASDFSTTLAPAHLQQLVKSRTLVESTINGQDSLLYARNIPNTHWTLVLVMDRDTIMAPVHEQLLTQLVIGFITIIVGVTILFFLSQLLFSNLEKIRQRLNEIADGNGDLTKRLPANSGDEIGQLAHSFNRFIEQLHGILSRLRQTSESLQSEAEQTSATAEQQHQRVQTHQSELHMVATAITEMASATQEISSNAEETSNAAQDTVNLSEEGRTQVDRSQESIAELADEVKQTTDIIDELNRHAKDISSILSTITDIAEQTNLLALNAAIEAARAGEHGRGFAVVADEVRVLSQRTHASTKEIENMIEMLQGSTDRAVDAMQKGGEKAIRSVEDAEAASQILRQITQAIGHINEMAAQIAAAAEEQASVTIEINKNTETIREVGDEMSLGSEIASTSAKTLKQLGTDVNQEIGRFTL